MYNIHLMYITRYIINTLAINQLIGLILVDVLNVAERKRLQFVVGVNW